MIARQSNAFFLEVYRRKAGVPSEPSTPGPGGQSEDGGYGVATIADVVEERMLNAASAHANHSQGLGAAAAEAVKHAFVVLTGKANLVRERGMGERERERERERQREGETKRGRERERDSSPSPPHLLPSVPRASVPRPLALIPPLPPLSLPPLSLPPLSPPDEHLPHGGLLRLLRLLHHRRALRPAL